MKILSIKDTNKGIRVRIQKGWIWKQEQIWQIVNGVALPTQIENYNPNTALSIMAAAQSWLESKNTQDTPESTSK